MGLTSSFPGLCQNEHGFRTVFIVQVIGMKLAHSDAQALDGTPVLRIVDSANDAGH